MGFPTVVCSGDGKKIELPKTPVRSTEVNGIVGYDVYETTYTIPSGTTGVPTVAASSDHRDVKVLITQADTLTGKALVKADYNGVVKTYNVLFAQE